MRRRRWTSGNQLELLENGEVFFPAVFAAIDAARHEVLIETFILFEDKVGMALQAALLRAAARGVHVELHVDGFGSADLGPAYVGALAAAGVRLHVFDPGRRFLGLRLNIFRRMHRKIVVVDGDLAFIGGINFSADHLMDFGEQAKQDYAAAVRGPIVEEVRAFTLRQVGVNRPMPAARSASGSGSGSAPGPGSEQRPGVGSRMRAFARRARRAAPASQPGPAPNPERPAEGAGAGAEAMFVTRDNHVHHNAIERHYRAAIRAARRRIVIANAYFFPGYLLLRELRRAARRGVDVRLVLQGKPDMTIVRSAALLYEHLQSDGVRVFEYCQRPLHGKVAVVDDEWATIGSSNLDPLSLTLNLEANLVVRDAGFNRALAERLETLIAEGCQEAPAPPARRWRWWGKVRNTMLFHVLRAFPVLAGWLLPRPTAKGGEESGDAPVAPAG